MNRTLIKKLILILLGNFILAFGVNCFMVSTGIIMGGATGIGLAVNKFTGINLSYVVWVLNFILFFLGLFFMGKAFAMSIILSTFFLQTTVITWFCVIALLRQNVCRLLFLQKSHILIMPEFQSQKAVRACTIRFLTLEPAKHEGGSAMQYAMRSA